VEGQDYKKLEKIAQENVRKKLQEKVRKEVQEKVRKEVQERVQAIETIKQENEALRRKLREAGIEA
jgi:hypothetical protein